jgi:SAM-dependent methyltransferase
MTSHFEDLANWIADSLRIDLSSRILEIGSNDGTLQRSMKQLGFDVEGVDPAANITARAKEEGFLVFNDFFSFQFVKNEDLLEKYDLVISCNSFAHVSDIRSIASGISAALKPNGLAIIEVQSWPKLVKDHSFDFVYHEHKYYYHLAALNRLMSPVGLRLKFVEQIPIHGGSYRLVFEKSDSVETSLSISATEWIPSIEAVRVGIGSYVSELSKLNTYLLDAKDRRSQIIGFGAAGRGNMLISFLDNANLIPYIVDESPERIGRMMGLSGIPIIGLDNLKDEDYEECVVFAWNHFAGISKKWPHKGKKLICPLPRLRIIDT